jgi:uncharacterized protein (TIGR00288 family)
VTPWWLRPTAEGASEEENREQDRSAKTSPPEPPALAESAPPAAEAAAELEPPIVEPEVPQEPLHVERFLEMPAPVEAGPAVEPAPEPYPIEPYVSASEPMEEPQLFYDEAEPEGEADGEPETEMEAAEEADRPEPAPGEEGRAAEARRKRSRRSRGGRKKPVRAAAAAEPAEEEDEEPEEPAHEEPAPRHEPPSRHEPAPRRIAALPPQQQRVPRSGESYVIPASEYEGLGREIIISVPERQRSGSDERKIAMFCDFENIALGVRDSEISKFDIDLVLERLLEKGKIIVKKAYADWERYSEYKRPFHEAAIELIDIPQKYYSGKNSADIKMVVDAMDLSYAKEHLDTFVIVSGDSDFSPLVSKLKENNKYVIGIGVKNSSSSLLIDNCDEFIYYEDVWRDTQTGPKLDGLNKKTAEAFSLMVESIQALIRENKDVLWGSMIKQTMQRKKPSFNEGYYGYSTFSELLEDAERKNIIKLKKDQRSGTYIVTGFAKSDAGSGAGGRRHA